MSNIIRPKVSNAIKEITSMDGSGKSKAQIDTKKEYDELKNYLSGNYEELNSTERNRIKELLNKAKEYLHITDKHDQDSGVKNTSPAEETSTVDNSHDSESSSNDVKDTSPAGETSTVDNSHNSESSSNDVKDTSPAGETSTVDNSHNTENNNNVKDSPNGDEVDSKGKKVVIGGKLYIEMPSGSLYDAMSGRKVK